MFFAVREERAASRASDVSFVSNGSRLSDQAQLCALLKLGRVVRAVEAEDAGEESELVLGEAVAVGVEGLELGEE